MEIPRRKPNRLESFDYSLPSLYFITICSDGRKNLFWRNSEKNIESLRDIQFTEYGSIVNEAISLINDKYNCVTVEKYVIMPNHVHLLLQIHSDENGRAMPSPTISTVIQQMKGYATKKSGFNLWQKSFHDHIVRGQADFEKIWDYIEYNPMKWKEDCFYYKD